MMIGKWPLLAGAAAGATLIGAGAHAQSVGSGAQVEEIVVTANRREENLQQVPITVSSFSANTLKQAAISSTDTLTAAVPGLTFTTGGNYATPYLRGIGTSSTGPEAESSVAIYVDGVYQTEENAGLFRFNNIQRVEVLKGPQGTLFGRNATGGVIQVITKDPGSTPHLDVTAGYGNYNTFETSGYASTPLGDTLAADIAVYYRNQADGWGRNLTTGKDVFKGNSLSVRSKWVWTPTDSTKVTLIGNYGRDRGGPGYNWHIFPNATGLDGKTGAYYGFYDTVSAYNGVSNDPIRSTNKSVSLKIEQDLGFARAVSISAFQRNRVHDGLDNDATPLQLVNVDIRTGADTYTQELQLLSPVDSKISWVVGGFFLHDNPQIVLDVAEPPTATLITVSGYEKATSWAGYGQATVPLGDSTHVTGGLRYTTQRNSIYGQTLVHPNFLVPGTVGSQAATFRKVTWRAALDHQFGPDILGYVSYNRGFKSGLFNLNNPLNAPVKPEVLDAYEAGLKTELFDHRIRLNGAGFYYKYKNIQVNAIQSGTQVFYNGAAAELYGLDVDFTAVASHALTFTGGFEVIHGKYTDFQNAISYVPAARGGNMVTSIDASGNPTVRTPRFSGNVAADYHVPLGAGRFNANLTYAYTSGYSWDPNDRLRQPRVSNVNGSIGFTLDHWEISVWTRNLLNKKYYVFAQSEGIGDVYSPAAPRTFGVTLGAHF